MAQYDGSIRINAKILVEDAKKKLTSFAGNVTNVSKKISSKMDLLRSKMNLGKSMKMPTESLKDLEEEYSRLEDKIQKLAEKQYRFLAIGGKEGSTAYKGMEYDLDRLTEKQDEVLSKIRQIEGAESSMLGKTFGNTISLLKNGIKDIPIAAAKKGIEGLKAAFQGFGSIGKKSLSFIGSGIKKATSRMLGFGKSVKQSGGMLSTFGSRFKSLALSLLIFNQITKAFNVMVSGIKEGFSNLYNENSALKGQVDGLRASLLTMKNALAGAFAPIVQIAIPYIQQFVSWLTSAISAVGQFIAALTGRKTYIKAVQQTAGAFEDTAGAANDAKEAVEGYLNPLDEVNKYNDGKDKGAGAVGGGAGGVGQMFEEVPVDDNISNMAKKFKEIMSQLFAPLKESWNREGKFVMDSWKFALQETWSLMKDIGRDFLTMWNEEATIQMFSDLLHIVGDIGLVAGNLAERFREAWNTNDVGLHILENIRDIFAIIIGHIRSAADYTVEWSKKLDFYPLLESINGLLEALKPLTDNIGSGLEWFYKNVLLPVAGWTIQEAIPTFLDMLSAAISALNEVITALQPLGQWLWENFLQPLGQWAGETIIDAMQTITDLLTRFGNWVSEHQEAVQNMAIIIGSFFAAFKIVTAVTGIVDFISKMGSLIGIVQKMAGLIMTVFNPWTIAIGAIIAIGVLLYKNWDEISAKAKETWDFVKEKFQEFDTWLQSVFTHDWTTEFGIVGEVFNAFFKNISNIWNSIKQVFGGIITFIKGVFTGNWRQAWEGIKQILKGIWNGIISIVKSPINGIISLINGMISAIVSGLNSAIRAFNRIKIPSWVPGIGGKGINISSITAPKIPYLAQGTVVPPNREFMAVLGDNKREPEIVSPISTIEQAVRNAMSGMNNNVGEITIKVPIYLDGKPIYEAVIKQGKIQQMSTGNNGFMLGTT